MERGEKKWEKEHESPAVVQKEPSQIVHVYRAWEVESTGLNAKVVENFVLVVFCFSR